MTVGAEHLDVAAAAPARASDSAVPALSGEGRASLRERVEAFDRTAIRETVARCGGNWAAAAEELGMHRSNLQRLGRRLGLRCESPRRGRSGHLSGWEWAHALPIPSERPRAHPEGGDARTVAPGHAVRRSPGAAGSGLSSLAVALSMLGYRCCSDIDRLPDGEAQRLLRGAGGRVFDAYVNVGCLDGRAKELAGLYPEARFIVTRRDSDDEHLRDSSTGGSPAPEPVTPGGRTLLLPYADSRSWKLLCEFLRCVPPPYPYPLQADLGMRMLANGELEVGHEQRGSTRRLEFDKSAWVAPSYDWWRGLPSTEARGNRVKADRAEVNDFRQLDPSAWSLREDTFPGNLGLFRPTNFVASNDGSARLLVRTEDLGVRRYSAAALSSVRRFLGGRFEVVVKPPRVPGVVTGVFLHRDSPRQEIDVEFVGRHPRHMLTNVFYNPGGEGARYDYGFRGTPILIELGFDASDDFHSYAMEWSASELVWFVDGRRVHGRAVWDPTPVPHLPMSFHVNVWPCRSRELAGPLRERNLPAVCHVRSLTISSRGDLSR